MTRYLLADVGGTHTRVAVAAPGGSPQGVARYRNRDLAGPGEALRRALAGQEGEGQDWVAAAAVAGPVEDSRVRLTNLGWSLSAGGLAREAGVARAVLINDYQALARALPALDAAGLTRLGGEAPAPGAAQAVLGPGTGLGVSGLIPAGTGWAVVAGEGGHVTLAAADDEEAALLAELRGEMGHVSAEALLCGPGLLRLYRHLGGEAATPEAVTAAAEAGDPAARRSLALFLRFLGTTAGNLALTLGARGGLFLAGGILPAVGAEAVAASDLYERFVAKGRFRGYLEAVPVYLIHQPDTATLLGLRAWLDDLREGQP